MTDFEQLYNTYFNDVYLYTLRLSGNEHIAEEITSDTFFKAMHSIDSFRGDCDVRVWLCQIAKNCYYSYRKKSNRIEHVDEDAIQELPDHALSVYIGEQTVSAERLAEILLGIRKCFDEAGVGFYAIDCALGLF